MADSSNAGASELERGRSAYARAEWTAAREALAAADEADGLGAEDLWRLAIASYLTGREQGYLDALERAHRIQREAGEDAAAAHTACWIGLHLAERGEMAQASGWFGRAQRLVEGREDEGAESGYLLLPRAIQRLGAGDPAEADRLGRDAAAIAERFDDGDLLALALLIQGRARLAEQRVDEGLRLLDEAMVAVATGELTPTVTGIIYCSVISACRSVYALARAQEWTGALTDWCERQPDMVAYQGECRVYRSELLQLHGAWSEALEEANRASGLRDDGPAVGLAHYQRGEVHRLLGELDTAEEAYRAASAAGREPQPGLALLRLAQGKEDAAVATLGRALSEAASPLQRIRLLPARVEALLAAGETERAEAACAELEEVASSYPSPVLEATVAASRGAVDLEAGRAEAALPQLRRAARQWRELEAPYEAARARVLLGRACRELGDEDGARLELEAARDDFDRLGARADRHRVDALIRGPQPSRAAHGLTARELEVLELVATGKTNRAIGEALFISEKTVARHLSNIFTKLDVSSRAAATAFAYEHGLVGDTG